MQGKPKLQHDGVDGRSCLHYTNASPDWDITAWDKKNGI